MQTVLIVDDSAFQRKFLERALVDGGFAVRQATNGDEALAEITANPPDCILTDLIMPDMRGLVLLETLQERDSQTPVVVLTADIQQPVEERCLELGAARVLHKPVKPEVLTQTLREVLELGAEPS
ncbi:MAG: response regulator [Acidobacteriota bacterium]